jgi:hypothetical protein
VLAQRLVQVLPVQDVERDERPRARPHPLHRRLIPAAPGVGERVRADVETARLGERGDRGGDSGPPVDHGAENIEQHRPHAPFG